MVAMSAAAQDGEGAMTIEARHIAVHHPGDEREPVVVVDHATGMMADLVEHAATRSAFAPADRVGSGYPGLLGSAPTRYVDALVQIALPLIAAHFGTGPVRPVRARGNFSLVTADPAALAPDQRVPHVDTADRWQFACVHYLCGEAHGGTGFFRHRATGFETIDPARLPAFDAARTAEAERDAARQGYFPADGDEAFAAIAACRARPDRIVLYRAALLHSGLVTVPPPHSADPRRGRLTGNLFLQCVATT